jgi:thymidylate synthase (FAD)
MSRITTPEADELLDKELLVLDKGFIRMVDYLGGDSRIVQSARVSYGAGTKSVREDSALIDYLLRNDHTSPFEQVVLTFHVKTPIFVARQWVRHRTARMNEISGRYSVKHRIRVLSLRSRAICTRSKRAPIRSMRATWLTTSHANWRELICR